MSNAEERQTEILIRQRLNLADNAPRDLVVETARARLDIYIQKHGGQYNTDEADQIVQELSLTQQNYKEDISLIVKTVLINHKQGNDKLSTRWAQTILPFMAAIDALTTFQPINKEKIMVLGKDHGKLSRTTTSQYKNRGR